MHLIAHFDLYEEGNALLRLVRFASVGSMKRTALYIRVSSVDQNPEMQLRELEAFIAARGWALHKVYQDTLTGTNSERPALKSLLEDARKRRFDIVLSWKIDRFFRSLRDLVVTLQELNDLGVSFVSYNDPAIDMSIPSGRLMIHIIGAFAEFEASLIKMRVRAGIANARTKGKHLGRPQQIDRVRVLALRQQGLSLRAIALEVGATKAGVSKILLRNARQMQTKQIPVPALGHEVHVNETKPSDTVSAEEEERNQNAR